MEPLEAGFDPLAFHRSLQQRRASIKQVLLAGDIVVGVGNIYASEALFLAGIRPTTRADRIGCYGDRQASTPVLDKLAERGVLFEHAYAPIPLTLPSHASMFTGLYPPEHGIYTNGKNRLGDGLPTLAETLQSRGYETAAFVASSRNPSIEMNHCEVARKMTG